jgi:hypothetical protein
VTPRRASRSSTVVADSGETTGAGAALPSVGQGLHDEGHSDVTTDPFSKLAQSILLSSVWQESAEVRCLWVALLCLCNGAGYVGASVPGLAHAANISLDECKRGLEKFCSPDEFSRDPSNEGRRLRRVVGGFVVVNYLRYRNRRTESQSKNAARQKRFREARERQSPPAGAPKGTGE